MSKMRRYINSVMVATAVATILLCGVDSSYGANSARSELRRFKSLYRALAAHHIDSLDHKRLIDNAIAVTLSELDPYTTYLDRGRSKEFKQSIKQPTIDTAYNVSSGVGYVKLALFGEGAAKQLRSAIHRLGSAESLILDLRGNKGGLVEEAIGVASLFLESGEVIFTREGRTISKRSYKARHRGEFVGRRLYILIDGVTASASEIVTAALQDHGRAVVVGERSFGKGLILGQVRLSDGSTLLVSCAEYKSPSGRSLESPYEGRRRDTSLGGVEPDIEIDLENMDENEVFSVIIAHMAKI